MYKKILLPLDGSKRAETILPHVENLAVRYNARIIILIVQEPALQLEIDEVINAERYLQERAQMIKDITVYATKIINRFKEKNIAAEFLIGKGPVVQAIVKTAAIAEIDLVAMTSHGRTGWTCTFYGSVAAGVLQNIDRPILMIRSRYTDSDASK